MKIKFNLLQYEFDGEFVDYEVDYLELKDLAVEIFAETYGIDVKNARRIVEDWIDTDELIEQYEKDILDYYREDALDWFKG